MSSTPSISPISHCAPLGRDRGEPDAAVAHQERGHAVPARGGEHRVPRDLAVVVRVHVDEAGRDEEPVRVDHLACVVAHGSDLADAPAVDGDVGTEGRRSRAVDDRPATNHQIMHETPYCSAPARAGRYPDGTAGVVAQTVWTRTDPPEVRRLERSAGSVADGPLDAPAGCVEPLDVGGRRAARRVDRHVRVPARVRPTPTRRRSTASTRRSKRPLTLHRARPSSRARTRPVDAVDADRSRPWFRHRPRR